MIFRFLIWLPLLAFVVNYVACTDPVLPPDPTSIADSDYLKRNETSELCTDDSSISTSSANWELSSNKTCALTKLFDQVPRCTKVNCGIKIEAYRFYDPQYPAIRTTLNISTPESFENLWFAFNNTAEGSECHNITVVKGSGDSLYYDCRRKVISYAANVNSIFTAFFKGQLVEYLFKIPTEKDLGDRVVFFYYHRFVNIPTITFQENERDTIYEVTISAIEEAGKSMILSKEVNISDVSTYREKQGKLVTVYLGSSLNAGSYSITVTSKNCDGPCPKPSSLEFTVIESPSSASFTVAIIILVLLLVGFAIPLVIHYQQQRFLEPVKGKMLMAFDAVSVAHTEMVQATRCYLHELLGIEILLDITDIPRTEHRDPSMWYQDAVETAPYVAVVVPAKVSSDAVRGSPYQMTYSLCLNLLEKRWKNVLDRKRSSKSKDGCVVIFLPDSDPSLMPKECRYWPKFYCPKQALSLRQHLQLNAPEKEKKDIFRFRLPQSLLPRSRTPSEMFEQILRQVKSKQSSLTEVVVQAQQPEGQVAACGEEDTHLDRNVIMESAFGMDPSVQDIKLIDDSNSSQDGAADDEDPADVDESTNLKSDSSQPQWKIY